MKLFKKALLATAVFGAMGAQAASINNDKFQLSAEGIALEVPAVASDVYFDIKVDKEHASGSLITLTFDNNVDLSGVEPAAGGQVTQNVGTGESQSGDIFFDYGTGSFTFNNVKVVKADKTKGIPASISFNVNLGNPLTANSAFRISFKDDSTSAPIVKVLGESTIQYKSVAGNNDDTVIETGTAVISEVVSQFDFEVNTKLDGLIKRDDFTAFTSGMTDTLSYTLKNNETLGFALLDAEASITFDGNFKGVTAATPGAGVLAAVPALAAGNVGDYSAATALATSTGTGTTVSSLVDGYDIISPVPIAPATTPVYVENSYTNVVTFTNTTGTPSINIPVTGDVEATVTITGASNATITGTGYTLYNDVPAGEWAIDATVINIPYLPVNAPETETFIHFANETDEAVEVIVTAIDNRGVEHGPFDLGKKLAKKTVTKLSEKEMDDLFTLDGVSTKLSVTFIIDADKGDVNAYAISQNDKGRTEVSTSQQRGN